jgi:LmbE family N-acetylglucosaminyl deacetylase
MHCLVLVAHADDESLGAGGTIPKLIKAGWDVSVVVFSEGVVRLRESADDNRSAAYQACKLLGTNEPHLLGFPDQKLDTIALGDLAQAVLSLDLQPDLILTHTDSDLNMDHRITFDVAKIVGRPRKKPVSIICCEIPNTSFWNAMPFHPNYYVDITDTLETKLTAFEYYRHEIMPFPHPWSRRGLELLAEYHGMQAGVRYAEAFRIVRAYEGHLL